MRNIRAIKKILPSLAKNKAEPPTPPRTLQRSGTSTKTLMLTRPENSPRPKEKTGQYVQSTAVSTIRPQKALLFKTASKKPDDPYLHSIRIKQMALKGDLPRALEYYKTKLTNKRIPYTAAVFNTVIDVLGHEGRFREAEQVYKEMRSRGAEPDYFTFCGLINALANNKEIGSAEALKAGTEIYEQASERGIRNLGLFNVMLKLLARIGDCDDVVRLFPLDMQVPKADSISYTILLSKLRNQPSLTWKPYYDRLLRDSVAIDGPLMTVILACVRGALEQSGAAMDIAPILSIVMKKKELLEYNNDNVPVHSMYLEVLRKAKLYQVAVGHFEDNIKPKLKARNLDDQVCSLILRVLNLAGRSQRVLSEFEAWRSDLKFRPTASAIQSIIDACERLRRPKCAISYIDGYLVHGRVVPTASLAMAALKYGRREHTLKEYCLTTLLPFLEKQHPAVHLECYTRGKVLLQ